MRMSHIRGILSPTGFNVINNSDFCPDYIEFSQKFPSMRIKRTKSNFHSANWKTDESLSRMHVLNFLAKSTVNLLIYANHYCKPANILYPVQ